MSIWKSTVDQKSFELLRDLAVGARLHRAEPCDGRLVLEQNGERRPSPYTSGNYFFLLDLGFVEGLGENGDPFYPVTITTHGSDYIAGDYWSRDYRPGRLEDGRLAIWTPDGMVDVSSAVRGLKGSPREMARIIMLNISRLAQR